MLNASFQKHTVIEQAMLHYLSSHHFNSKNNGSDCYLRLYSAIECFLSSVVGDNELGTEIQDSNYPYDTT